MDPIHVVKVYGIPSRLEGSQLQELAAGAAGLQQVDVEEPTAHEATRNAFFTFTRKEGVTCLPL